MPAVALAEQSAESQARVPGLHDGLAAVGHLELGQDVGHVGADQCGQKRLDRREARIGRFDLGDELGLEFIAGEEDFPLVWEVAVEGALLKAGGARELRDRGAFEPLRLEQLERARSSRPRAAWRALDDLGVRPGELLLVHGAGSTVGEAQEAAALSQSRRPGGKLMLVM